MQPKGMRFYNVMMAFQHFGGKPLKATDHAEVWTEQELDAVEVALRRMALNLRQENATAWPELHTLANQIERWVGKTAPAEEAA